MKNTAKTETEMRIAEVPWPDTIEELNEYISSLETQEHDYGTCVYAVSMATAATFNYMAGKLGITGFQASCADMDVLRRTRSIKCPFMLIKANDMLYPQYNIRDNVEKALADWKSWASEEAKKLLETSPDACQEVKDHWVQLANGEEPLTIEKVRFFRDGNQWCCVGEKFTDLQTFPAGFGDTFEQAFENLKEVSNGSNGKV